MKNLLLIFIALQTVCGFTQTVVFSEDFQSGSIPGSFTIVDNDGNTPHTSVSEFSNAWIITDDPSDNTNKVVGSTSYFDPAAKASRWLIPPSFTLGAFGNYLKWKAKSHDPSFPDSYIVLVSTTDAQISSFTDTAKVVYFENASWTTQEVNLDAYNGQSIYVAFINNTYDGFKLYLDSIEVRMEDPVGLEELADGDFKVYPNPVTDNLKVDATVEYSKAQLLDLKGTIIREFEFSDFLDFSDVQHGVYIVQFYTYKGIVTRKVVKS